MKLPDDLRRSIEHETERIGSAQLAKAVADLSNSYRTQVGSSKQFISSDAERLAYIVTRLPATFAAITSTLLRIRARLPETKIRSLLDIGAGPGTAMWAASQIFEELESITLIERDKELIKLGKRFAQESENLIVKSADWLSIDLNDELNLKSYDLIVASYSLGELDQSLRKRVILSLWNLTEIAFAIIEPGTPKGFSNIIEIREALIKAGAKILAPCPHASTCPMIDNDWCHFSERVERTSLHRRAKEGTLSYEDEKFSYVIATRVPLDLSGSRIIRHPLKRMGHIYLDLCTKEGLRREVVTRKEKDNYHNARKAEWGDWWEEQV
jgi:ribosomal protein RSM22 (predicted rRNA methylase)